MNRMMVVLGLTLLTAGVIVGFVVHVHSNGYDCGAALYAGTSDFDNSIDQFNQMLDGSTASGGDTGCADARSSAQALPIVLLVLGLGVVVGSAFIPADFGRRKPESVD